MDQQPSSTLTGITVEPNPDTAAQGKVEMVFRFWGANARSAEGSAGEAGARHHPGVLALIEDAVASKRGVFHSAQEYLYISRLKRPADALVISRQVLLGLEGFRARHGSGPVEVSIAIDTGGIGASGGAKETGAKGTDEKRPAEGAAESRQGEPAHDEPAHDEPAHVEPAHVEPPHDLVTLLKLSKPAQILLTHELCQEVTAIKGLPMRSFPARFGVYEYLWTAEEKLDLRQSEPQLTLAALPAAHAAAPATAKEKTGTASAGSATKAFEAPATAAATVEEAPAKTLPPKMLIFGGAGLVAVLALAAIGIHLAHRPAASAPPVQETPAAITAPAPGVTPGIAPAVASPAPKLLVAPAPAVKPAQHGTPPPTHTVAKPAAAQPQPVQEVKTPPAPSPECTLGAETSRYVGLGEQARGRGDYANAVRIFREVLACDPNNAGAKEGLEKALQGQQQSQ
jgi:hypothetical protein